MLNKFVMADGAVPVVKVTVPAVILLDSKNATRGPLPTAIKPGGLLTADH